jgi:hypothetical protein
MNFNKFLKTFVIFLLIFVWIFSGFPRIWQKPPIPPKIQEAQAAFGTGGATCTNQSKTAGTSLSCTVGTENFDAGNIAILWFAGDNTATVDGNDQLLSSVTDSKGNSWTVQRCFTNAQGAAAAGATTCLAWSKITTTLVSGTDTITANFSSITAKAILTREFTVAAGATIAVAGTPQDLANDAADPGSMTISGLASGEYLFVRAIALERANAAITPTANYTNAGNNGTSGGAAASNMNVAGEFRIFTGTSNTSDPTATAVDNANIFIAFREVTPSTNQSAFRWRNDDGSESSATWKAAENTAITNVSTSEIIRIRIEVEEINGAATTVNARLEFSSDATSCTTGTWTALDTSTTAWRVTASANITNGDPTTNQLTTSAKTFTAGRIFDTQNEDTTGVSLNNTHTEWEWAIRGNGASGSTTYRFRITDSGTALNTYTNCAQLTTAAAVSVSVSDGTVDYGIMPANTSKSTLPGELNDMQTATNDGNVTENFNIKGQDATGGGCTWTLASTNGTDQYVHQFCNNTDYDCSSPPTNYTALTTTYQTLKTSIPVSGTVQIQLRLTTPTSSSCFGQQSVNVTIQAVQP